MTALLELVDVSRVYGKLAPTTALDGISLTIDDGEFVAVVGASGAGKSTLLNILGLLEGLTSGRYLIDGVDTTTLGARGLDELRSRIFGFVFQESHVLPEDTVARNIALPLRIQGVSRSGQAAVVSRTISRLGIAHRSSVAGKLLSGGERQRLAIARAVSTSPRVILADEPTGNLDSANSAAVIALLRELNLDGATVVVITHDDTVAAAADRVVRLADGSIASSTDNALPPFPSVSVGEPRGRRTGMAPVTRRPLLGVLGIVSDALSSLTLRPLRSLALLIVFLLGTGGLVAATGISETTSNQVSQRLAQSALDELTVTLPEQPSLDAMRAARAEAVSRIATIDGVEGLGSRTLIAAADAKLSLLPPGSTDDRTTFTGQVVGADADYLRLNAVTATPSGAETLFRGPFDGRIAIVGRAAAEQIGIAAVGPGVTIWIDGDPVDVVGLVESGGRLADAAQSVFVSPAVADTIGGGDRKLVVRTTLGYPAPVSDAIPATVDPGNPAAITVGTTADLRTLRRGVADDLGVLVSGVSVLLLVLACLSAAAVLFLSIQARTGEIGLRRALGTSRTATASMFVLEGAFLGLAGGCAGVAAGLVTVVAISYAQSWIPVISPSSITVGLAAGLATGVAAALLPALRASHIQPADAVRHS